MTLEQMISSTQLQRPCALPLFSGYVIVCQNKVLPKIPVFLLEKAKCIYSYNNKDNLQNIIHTSKGTIPVTPIKSIQHPVFDTIVFFHDVFDYGVACSTDQLISKHFGTHSFFIYMPIPYNFGITTTHIQNYYLQNKNDLEYVFDLLDDEESKTIMAARIKALETGDIGYLKVSSYPEYYHPLVQAREGDIVIDGGISENCYPQKMILESIGSSGKLFGFEPDPLGMEKATEQLSNENYRGRCRLVPFGLWKRKETLYFRIAGQGTQVVNNPGNGILECPVISIDEFSKASHLNTVDFIKLDIEGSEKEAILGAIEMITRHEPKLAISLYHKPEDLYLLPKLIAATGVNYKYYMGHHHSALHETILYCTSQTC